MLIHEASSIVLLGDGYTAKLGVILEFMDGSGFNDHQQQGARTRVTSDEAPRISAQIDNALPRRLSGKRIPSERADVNA
jgi:hypothetical protein